MDLQVFPIQFRAIMIVRGTSSLSLEAFMLQRMPNPGQRAGQGEEPVRGEAASSAFAPPPASEVQLESQEPEASPPKDESAEVGRGRGRGKDGKGRGRGGRKGRGRGRGRGKTNDADEDQAPGI